MADHNQSAHTQKSSTEFKPLDPRVNELVFGTQYRTHLHPCLRAFQIQVLRIGQLPLGLFGLNLVLNFLGVQTGCGCGLLLLPLQHQTLYFITPATFFLTDKYNLVLLAIHMENKQNTIAKLMLN